MQDECKLGHGGRLGYIDAISDLMDFRKINGASDAVLRNLSATELYLKRPRKTVAKMMRLQWSQDLDIDTLEARGHWATMEELLQVVTFHLPRFEDTVKTCKSCPGQVNPSHDHARFGVSKSASATSVENAEMEIPPQATTDDPPIEQLCSQRKLRRVLKFTSNEDDCLKRGVDRHGFGQWTAILRDPDFKFQEGRTADSLKKRAGLKLFSGQCA